MTVVANGTITAAVLTHLEAAASVGASLVGDGEKPSGAGWQGERGSSEFVGYVVVWPLDGTIDGSIGDPDSDADSVFQVTSVGATRSQAEAIADLARAALTRAALVVAGRGLIAVMCDEFGGATPDRSVEPAVFMVADRFTVRTDS